jgi:hypothetical protein
VDEEFIGCEQKSIWPGNNGLQKMLKWSTITANAYMSPVDPRLPGPLKDFRHVPNCHPSCFNGIPQLILHVTSWA